MDFNDQNESNYASNVDALTRSSVSVEDIKVLQCVAGLKAMLDVLPENTDNFSSSTVEGYLWVIEWLLQKIYDGLEDHAGEER